MTGQRLASELSQLAAGDPPVRFANHAVGVFYLMQDSLGQAAKAFEREGKFPEAKESRERAATIYVHQHDIQAIERLAADPLYADDLPTYARIRLAVDKHNWSTIWRLLPQSEWERFEIGPFALAAFTGLCWFLFSLQAGQAGTIRGARTWLCVVAVFLGTLSIWPTDFFILWQEEVWGLERSENITRGIYFFVLGVGLREEFSKLLLLLPLMPFIVRRGAELEALIVSACVGLGFAAFENSAYFAGSMGSSSVGRFLTANFFHMSATGLIGLAVFRGLQFPKQCGPEALAMFGVIVLTHGLYDAMGSIPVLIEYSFVSIIIYVFLAYQFFHELRSLRIESPDTVSLTANFLCGLSLVTAVTFVYLSSQVGPRLSAMMLGSDVLSMALVAYMFLREMPSSLVPR
jgi:RsiW-degrading membrane proteinase PrsW (M82 family)